MNKYTIALILAKTTVIEEEENLLGIALRGETGRRVVAGGSNRKEGETTNNLKKTTTGNYQKTVVKAAAFLRKKKNEQVWFELAVVNVKQEQTRGGQEGGFWYL